MKKITFMILILTALTFLGALSNEEALTVNNSVRYSYSLTKGEEIPEIISRTFALPANNIELVINSMKLVTYDESGNVVSSTRSIDSNLVTISNTFQMRELHGFSININSTQNLRNGKQVVEAVEFELHGLDMIDQPVEVSEAFVNSYMKLATNYRDSYLAGLPLSKPKMLIVNSSSSATAYVNAFATWKRACGFTVDTILKDASWTSATVVRSHIAAYYEANRPDYILLLGDTSGNLAIPTNMYQSPDGTEDDADDNFYTMLEGDDYFPEAFIGRFSFNYLMEFGTLASKTIKYEKEPFRHNPAWMSKALVVAGNYAEGNLQPATPVRMSRWIRERFLDAGYTQVDTVFYPPSYPGTSLIQSSINQGVQYISYRGWGDANGWHYPLFHMDNLIQTNNVNTTPIVYSIVCNTGDFANSVSPSFGEKWMTMGTAANPGGCVAFVGPSDLHTKTKYNNAISSGMFSSFLQHDNRIFGTTVLDGKLELYQNYPLNRGPNDYVAFYFRVYNMLCDPSLKMWVGEPLDMEITGLPNSLDQGTSSLEFVLPDMEGAILTSTKDNVSFEYARIRDGRATLPINTEMTGDVTIQVTYPNYEPYIVIIPVSASNNIAITNIEIANGMLQPGYTSDVTLTLKNYGTDYSGVTANLASSNPNISISNADQNVGNLANDATTDVTYSVTVSADAERREAADFTLDLEPSGNSEKFSRFLSGASLEFQSVSGEMLAGQSNEISLTFKNAGNVDLNSGSVRVRALNTAIINDDINVNYSAVQVNDEVVITFAPEVDAECTPGRSVQFRLDFIEDGTGYDFFTFVMQEVGGVTADVPTGPDAHGYWAYGSNDTGHSATPTYDWIEIDPTLGGSGTSITIGDDESAVRDLPFTFRYYGQDFDQVTICSNGWISFGESWYVNFRNLNIPSLLGPQNQVSPYWDDLKGLQTSEDVFADMHLIHYYDSVNNQFIIQWSDAYSQYTINQYENAELEKFQVILSPIAGEDGDITFQYHTITNPSVSSNYATVGIENESQMIGIPYTYANIYPASASELEAGFALKFTKTAPDTFVGNNPTPVGDVTALNQNYPNPFNPETNISFFLNKDSKDVNLSVYNVKGQLVKTLVKDNLAKGVHNVVWSGLDNSNNKVASGVYYYRLETSNKTISKKMILMK
ncbi:MAG: hypothetical protein B6226_05250 [Candidatus Cloacimonetes bacterium 4572_65]|nr:MAG: hypothetical protein B6226_05250 [Candidatus Cloacimonetes bacterium 4572_65]